MKYIAVQDLSLLEAASQLSPQSSKTTLRQWIKEGRVAVDGTVVLRGDAIVEAGQAVTLGARKHYVKGGIQLVYEDRYLAVIDKPAGILTVATAFEKKETAYAFLNDHYRPQRVFVVHRLDQETSGVMVFARTEAVKDALKELFEKHALERKYVAIVEGEIKEPSGTWSCYLYEDKNYVVHPTEDQEKGRLAVTHYKVLHRSKGYSFVELTLETGRKNQIRVHCQMAGHPIVGDKKYGSSRSPLKRLGLHARFLAFIHPVTKQQMRFESPIPEDFLRFKERMRKGA